MPEEKLFPLDWKSLSEEDLSKVLKELDIRTEQDLNAAIQEALNAEDSQ